MIAIQARTTETIVGSACQWPSNFRSADSADTSRF
jgi:hypothetical protein